MQETLQPVAGIEARSRPMESIISVQGLLQDLQGGFQALKSINLDIRRG